MKSFKNSLKLMKKEHGMAMVEVIVMGAFVFVPMYLGIQLLGKVADVNNITQIAARYVAWERTIYSAHNNKTTLEKAQSLKVKTDEQIFKEIKNRIFNDRKSKVEYKNTNIKTLQTDPLWTDTAGEKYIGTASKNFLKQNQKLTIYKTPEKDITGKALDIAKNIKLSIAGYNILGPFLPAVDSNNLAVTKFRINDIASESQVYKRLFSGDNPNLLYRDTIGDVVSWNGLNFEAQSAVLTNAWTAHGKNTVTDITKSMVPTYRGGALGTVFITGPSAALAANWDIPLSAQIVSGFGRLGEDVVPNDRLGK